MWIINWINKIDSEILLHHLSSDKSIIRNELKSSNLGYGNVKLSDAVLSKSRLISNSEFKEIVNGYFKVEIQKLGFIGNDYKYSKENNTSTSLINIFPSRYGGSFQVDLLVKINEIKYPPDFKNFKPNKSLKLCEFSKRLAPINVDLWQWPFKNNINEVKLIFDDVIRLIVDKGNLFFKKFENIESFIDKVSFKTHLDNIYFSEQSYPDLGFPNLYYCDYNDGIIPANFFLFEYSRLNNKIEKALEYAIDGLKLKGASDDLSYNYNHRKYHEIYATFIENHSNI